MATPAPVAFCVIGDGLRESHATMFKADANSAFLCVEGHGRQTCGSVELSTGTWTDLAMPPEAPLPAFSINTDDATGNVQLCNGSACRKAEVPVPPIVDGTTVRAAYELGVNADGTLAVATGAGRDDLITILNVSTGKKRASVRVKGCARAPYFAGETIYVPVETPCHDLSYQGLLYTAQGKRIGVVKRASPVARPVHVADSQYAVAYELGEGYHVVDVRTGATAFTASFETPETCRSCGALDDSLSERIIRRDDGTLLILGDVLRIVQPSTGTVVRTFQLPACKP
jgi:hypothetical protein